MKLLILGGGGREHALAWKLSQSPLVHRIFVAPGNGGTAIMSKCENVAPEDVLEFARNNVDLTIVGSEAPLADGIVNRFQARGLKIWGPTQAASRIEYDKSFAKKFMERYNIATAQYQIFEDVETALEHVKQVDYPVVIKASGLAAGKGVILPETVSEAEAAIQTIMVEEKFGAAGQKIVIEERLEGEEISVLAFCDGIHTHVMPTCQDHKRVFDGDKGLNTGGMGAYSPVPNIDEDTLATIKKDIFHRTVTALNHEGTPFVGVLFAGLMLTEDGPKVLEFNCRFGDPETQVLMMLLESDLLPIIDACLKQTLNACTIRWKPQSAVTVVLAADGYPEKYGKGYAISGLEDISQEVKNNIVAFHAGTTTVANTSDGSENRNKQSLVSSGGRVLSVSTRAKTLENAVYLAYDAVDKIHFDTMMFRKDIAGKALNKADYEELVAKAKDEEAQQKRKQTTSQNSNKIISSNAYAEAGVSLAASEAAVTLLKDAVSNTHNLSHNVGRVLAGVGAFGGMFALETLPDDPVLVASTDGVGTKVKLAAELQSYESIGQDIVNHCLNDIACAGAELTPLFFLDYIASSKLEPTHIASIVTGMSKACASASCAILGGETAEMPGVYNTNSFDVVGTIIGLVDRTQCYPKASLQTGDVLLGLPSSGPHTNGYSLIRRLVADEKLSEPNDFTNGIPLGKALLAPHRSYLEELKTLEQNNIQIQSIAHITGGGIVENLPRALTEGLTARIDTSSWQTPELFNFFAQKGNISLDEMYQVFNMGVGMILIIPQAQAKQANNLLSDSFLMGEVITGEDLIWHK